MGEREAQAKKNNMALYNTGRSQHEAVYLSNRLVSFPQHQQNNRGNATFTAFTDFISVTIVTFNGMNLI